MDEKASVITVTPAMAQKWLTNAEENGFRNRRLKEKVVARYAAAMKAGRWTMNGESISIDPIDVPINGYHRLNALIMADTPLRMTVVRGVDRATFPTFDSGSPRGGGDVLSIMGYPYSAQLGAALGWVIRSEEGSFLQKNQIPNYVYEAAIKRHPDLVRAVEWTMEKRLIGLPPGIMAFGYYMASRVAPQALVDGFFVPLKTGLNLRKGDAAGVLRDTILQKRAARRGERVFDYIKIGMLSKAWNFYLMGRKVDRIRVATRSSGKPEAIQPFLSPAEAAKRATIFNRQRKNP